MPFMTAEIRQDSGGVTKSRRELAASLSGDVNHADRLGEGVD